MSMSEQAIRLTQYSHGAGCGCKISPKVLETILHSEQAKFVDPNLLVGNETSDDAAVYDLGNGTSIVSTTDFFMPIVDNPFDFGALPPPTPSAIFSPWAGNRLWRLPFLAGRSTPWRRKLPAKW
jgi:selenophosphate synthase